MHTFRLPRLAGLLSIAAGLTLSAIRAEAQQPQPPVGQDGEVDLALTYIATHADHTDGAPFWLQGGAVEMNAQFYRGFGLTASGAGMHANGSTNSAALDLVTIVFGPSYTFHAGKRISVFGEALLGEAHGLHSLFSYGSGPLPSLTAGTTDSANALAFETGGGINFRLSPHFAVRPVQVDYLRTELPNGGTNVQNNIRISGGVVATFGSHAGQSHRR
jgi:hypothetical protein